MAHIFSQNVGQMKLGVALPIANPSFEHYGDAAKLLTPLNWTKLNSIVASRVEPWVGQSLAASIADEGSSINLTGSSIPNNDNMRLESDVFRYWYPSGPSLAANLKFYFSIYLRVVSMTTPGGSAQVRFALVTANNSALTSSTQTNLDAWTSADIGSDLVRRVATITSAVPSGHNYGKVWVRLRDAAAMSIVVDELGVMFDPFANAGFTLLTNMFPVNGPKFLPFDGVEDTRGAGGTQRRMDFSGGARGYRIELEFDQEPLATYEVFRRYNALNKGSDGREPMPLAIETNVPGLPPFLVVNITRFSLVRSQRRAETYAGGITFETVYR